MFAETDDPSRSIKVIRAYLHSVEAFAEKRHLYHYGGVMTVGVGDSAAAIFGSRYGTHHWPESSKSKEGTAAMVFAQILFGILLCIAYIPDCTLTLFSILRLALTCTVCAFVEAHIKKIDNIALPFIAYIMLW